MNDSVSSQIFSSNTVPMLAPYRTFTNALKPPCTLKNAGEHVAYCNGVFNRCERDNARDNLGNPDCNLNPTEGCRLTSRVAGVDSWRVGPRRDNHVGIYCLRNVCHPPLRERQAAVLVCPTSTKSVNI
ncbi:hypothetical protein LSAT2_008385 [Lamellibrachia satsuma]|nr:hypothetical protein LSAT2_008385 [Lamellibrachia satsuma]